MKNYNKVCFYKLKHINDINDKFVYIGHNTNYAVRKYQHKRRCNDVNDKGYNLKVYQFIRKTGGFDFWEMVKIEDYPCKNYKELSTRERYWIEIYNSKLNSSLPLEYI